MKNKRNTAIALMFIAFLIYVYIAVNKFHYNDIYLLTLNGRIDNITVDIKERMHIKVSNEEYDLAHYWPTFRKEAVVGDSVYKKPKDYTMILIKKGTKEKIICAYK